jgi:hypothetical protein
VIKVRFNQPDEFIAEMRARGPNVEGLVRVTGMHEMTRTFPIGHLYVFATYVRRVGDVEQLVELRHYCGQVVGGPKRHDDAATTRADVVSDQLRAAIEEAGHQYAAGTYEPVEAAPA